MQHYAVFGRTLRAELPLPELVPQEASAPWWTVRQHHAAPEALPEGAILAGAERIYDDIHASLHRHPHGWRITVDDTGIFDWDASSRCITCWRRPDGTDDFLRAHLLGRVLGTALHDDGHLVLHGSAVVTPAGAIGFLAPKGFGKSSLALALARQGALLLTDDTVAIDLHAFTPSRPHVSAEGASTSSRTHAGAEGAPTPSRPHALPGIVSPRLLPDAAAELGAVADSNARADGKHVVTLPGDVRVASAAAPLAAVYLLLPASAIDGDRAAARAPLPAVSALAALTGHAKVGAMLGPAAAPDLLRRAAAVLAHVPVQGLVVTRNLARLTEAALEILSWHGGSLSPRPYPPTRPPAHPPA
jgi:hypothetical protein